MKIDPDLRRRTLRAAIALLETAHDPEHVFPHAVPLLDALGSSALGDLGRAQLLEDPALSALAVTSASAVAFATAASGYIAMLTCTPSALQSS